MLARGSQLPTTLTPDQSFFMVGHLRRLEDPVVRKREFEMLRSFKDTKYKFFLLKDRATQTLRKLITREYIFVGDFGKNLAA